MGIVIEDMYKARLIDKKINQYLQVVGAICVEGPKWCGKTWTSSHHAKSEYLIGDPKNNFQNKKLVQMDNSVAFVGEHPRLIDEWQEVPELWDATRMYVDKEIEKGLYILTGSATPKKKGIMHSGAGRIAKIRMETMSLWESGDSTGDVSLKEICEGTFDKNKIVKETNIKTLAYLIIRGGWPGNIGVSEELAYLIPKSYFETILNEDFNKLDGEEKYDLHKVHLLMKSLARNESTTVSLKTIVKDIKGVDNEDVSSPSVSKYIEALNRMFLISNQSPFSPNIVSSLRVKQKEKIHYCDPAFACAILGITQQKLINDLYIFGFMFESMVERDLRVYSEAFGAKLYHYQDYEDREIDAIIEMDNGDWCGIEIKLGIHQVEEAANNLLRVSNAIIKNGGKAPKSLCVICGTGNAIYKRDDGIYVVPICSLKE